MKNIMKVSEAESIINNWIDEAIKTIESKTNVVMDHNDIMEQLADSEWIFTTVIGDEENEIDMKLALIQISYIVERNINWILAERAE